MESSKAIVDASSGSLETPKIPPESQSQISALLQEMWQQLQESMEGMVKMTGEIEQSSAQIMGEIEKCKELADTKNRSLKEDKDRVQKAAIAVLEMLTDADII